MLYWMKPLPEAKIDHNIYKPFIQNAWFRTYFMIFVYALQLGLIFASVYIGVWRFANIGIRILVFALVYVIHELLHIAVVYRLGDLSLTHSGIFCWLHSNAKMTKKRFLLFMSLPFIVLTVIPALLMYFCTGEIFFLLRFVAWINGIIAGADIINSALIIMKPGNAIFYRGFYKCETEDKRSDR